MKHLIVVNPNAGTYSEEFENSIKAAFEGLEFEIYKTTGPRSVIPFLKDFFKKETDTVRVYACGGDGTVHEVANGLVGIKNVELAIYPVGTGNDFIKIYGGKDKFSNFKSLIEAKAHPIDISKITWPANNEEVYSINVINFGFDAIVGAMGNYYKENGYPEKAQKKYPNPYDYALHHDAMKHGLKNTIDVYADGEKLNSGKILLATLAQGQYVGGQFHASPKSDNTDGLIDVCVLRGMSIIGLGMIIKKYTNGKHLDKPNKAITYRRAKEIKMNAPEDFDVCIDGEMVKGNDFTVTIVPGAINIVVPE